MTLPNLNLMVDQHGDKAKEEKEAEVVKAAALLVKSTIELAQLIAMTSVTAEFEKKVK